MDRFQYIAESDPNIAFSKTLKQEPFFSSLLLCILRVNAACIKGSVRGPVQGTVPGTGHCAVCLTTVTGRRTVKGRSQAQSDRVSPFFGC